MIWDLKGGVGEGAEEVEEGEVEDILVDKTVDMLHLWVRRGEDRTQMEHQKREEE